MPPASKNARPFKPPTRVSNTSASSATVRRTVNVTSKGSRLSNASNSRTGDTEVVELSDGEDSGDEYGSDVEGIDSSRITTNPKPSNSRRVSAAAPTTPRRRSTAIAAGAENDPLALIEEDQDAPTIPRPLLTRILYEGFEDKGMKINKEAMNVVELYTRVFVKEAVARSRQMTKDYSQNLSNGTFDGNWLQVDDLEKIAPQLMLDF
jgi:hypothetical protein